MAKDSRLVLAFFENEDAADRAAGNLQEWAKANSYVRLDAIGVLVKDENGEIKTHKLGPRQTSKGLGIGMTLGVIAAVASGGVTLFEGVAVGGLGGGGIGFLFHKGLGLSRADAERITGRLDAGHAAVGVLALPDQAPAMTEKLTELGGEPEVHDVSSEHMAGVSSEDIQELSGAKS